MPILGDIIGGVISAATKPLENIGGVSRINAQNQGDIVQQALLLKQKQQQQTTILIVAVIVIIIFIVGVIAILRLRKKKVI